MKKLKIYDYVIDGHEIYNMQEEQNKSEHEIITDILNGMVWIEIEASEQEHPKFSRELFSGNGVTAFYDYGADYYYFSDNL